MMDRKLERWLDRKKETDMVKAFYGTDPYVDAEEDIFDNAVEYTDIPAIEGQIQVSIEFNKYTELIDRGLLVEWSGVETIA